ncbi:MAG: glycosyltransferase family 39 protein, partial [Chloroflexota bacterium]
GLLGFFRPPLLWALLLVVSLLLRRSLLGWLGDLRDLLRSLRVESVGQGFAIFYILLMVTLALLIALAPPTHWDSLAYHLVGVQRAIHAGTILPQSDIFYLGLPQNVEMLFGLTLGLFGRDTAAAPVHLGLGVIGLLATAGVTRRFAGRSAGWLAALLLLSAYNVWALLGWAYVDLGTLAYGALALIAATAWREQRTRGWLIMMGIIVGLAMGVKYTTLALGIALGLFVLLHEPRRVVRNGVMMTAAALLTFLPWAAKGLLLYGNPIYPLIIHGLNWNAGRMEAFAFSGFSLVARGDAWQLPILPVAATIFGRDFVDGFGFTLGPWLMTLFLLLPLVWVFLDARARRLALDAVTLILPILVVWGVMASLNSVGMQTRLMIVVLPAFAVAGAVALRGLALFPKKPFDIHFIVRGVLVLTLALNLLDAVRQTVFEHAIPYLTAHEDIDAYMYQNTGAYYNALHSLPPNSRVTFMWEPRSYHCPPTTRCTPDAMFDNWKLAMINEGISPNQVFERYRASGEDYLLVFRTFYDQYLEFSLHPDLDRAFPAALDRWMTPVWTDGVRYTLYGWRGFTGKATIP